MDQASGNGAGRHPSAKDSPEKIRPRSDRPAMNHPQSSQPPWLRPQDIKAIRQRLRLTQRLFAGVFGFSAATLRHWERGNRHPTGSALVLLAVIRENPRVVLQAVRKVRKLAPGSLPAIEQLESCRASPGFAERPHPPD